MEDEMLGETGQTQGGDLFKGHRRRSRYLGDRGERSALLKSRQSCFSFTPLKKYVSLLF